MRSPRRLAVRIALIALWLALAFFLLFPFYYALVSSLRPAADIFHASYWPDAPTLDNYRAVMTEQPFARNIFNSIVVAAFVVLLSLGLATFDAFALAPVQFAGRAPPPYNPLAVFMGQ